MILSAYGNLALEGEAFMSYQLWNIRCLSKQAATSIQLHKILVGVQQKYNNSNSITCHLPVSYVKGQQTYETYYPTYRLAPSGPQQNFARQNFIAMSQKIKTLKFSGNKLQGLITF